VAVFLLVSANVSAQSLADVARREAERRKTVKSNGKVYTNDSLRGEAGASVAAPAAPVSGQPASEAGASPPSGVQPQGGAATGQAQPGQDDPKTEAYWKKRMAAEREALSRAQIFAEALQSRINALSTDFVNRDDPAQRNVIAADRQKAMAELDRVNQEIKQHQKAITDIQTEARRAGVPAGWVR
jgi:hypothetical protein